MGTVQNVRCSSCMLFIFHNGHFAIANPLEQMKTATPVVTWHGITDSASSCLTLIDTIKESLPDVYVLNVMIGDNEDEDYFNSVLMPADQQIETVCEQIRNDPKLADGYNGVAYSQGGLLLRGVAQRCPNPPMKNLITMGSPHEGVYGVPECLGETVPLCELVRELISLGAYVPWVQDLVTPAQYWHDPLNATAYLAGSHYLADINNYREQKNEEYKKAVENLENMVLVAWKNDTTIQPLGSSHFEFYRPGDEYEVLPLKESPMYQEDWLGLRALDESGRLHFLFTEGDHMAFDSLWFTNNVVVPFLMQ